MSGTKQKGYAYLIRPGHSGVDKHEKDNLNENEQSN
jgi:hypothetical protein